MHVSLASPDPLPNLNRYAGKGGSDNCLCPIRSIPPDSGGTYLTCITYVGGWGLLRSWAVSNVRASNSCSWTVKVG